MQEFSASYRKWLEAERRVSDCEKRVFEHEHPLTEEEMSRLRALRRTAGMHLGRLINELDEEVERLHQHPPAGIAKRGAVR